MGASGQVVGASGLPLGTSGDLWGTIFKLRLIITFGALLRALVVFWLSFVVGFGTKSLYYLVALLFG